MNRSKLSALALALAMASSLHLGALSNAETPASEPPRMAVFPDEIRPGDPMTVAFAFPSKTADDTTQSARVVLIAPDGRSLASAPGFPLGLADDGVQVFCAILAVPSTAPTGTATIRLQNADGSSFSVQVELAGRDFVTENIDLNQHNTSLRTAEDPKKTAESAALWHLLVSFDPAAAFAVGAFLPPVESTRRTSTFADRRRYRYADGTSDTSIHAGLDYGVPRGTPVRASAAGKVVLARTRIVTGNSVVIEHLPGVFTLYYHLDKIEVVEGQDVAVGQQIALSGSTGLSTGPHLHWEVRVAGEAADPDAFIARPVLDKDAVLSKMSGHHDR
jgi:murein DD-endopeptidase MepM/ murein hydrolase activator NlpD